MPKPTRIQFNDWYPSIGANKREIWDMVEAPERAEHYVRESMASYIEDVTGDPKALDALGFEDLKRMAAGVTVEGTGKNGRIVKADLVRALQDSAPEILDSESPDSEEE